MNFKTLLFVALVLSCVYSESMQRKYPMRRKQTIMSVLAQVESKLKAGGPVEQVIRLLEDYEEQIRTEQANHDALYERQTVECEDEAAYRAQEVKEATSSLADGKSQLSSCEEQHQRATGDLAFSNKQFTQNQQFLYLLEETRTRDAQSWEETQVSYSANKAAVSEAQDILQSIWSGSSDFIQLARHANKMLIQAAKIKKTTVVNEVFGAFAELALKQLSADDGVLERIKELLRKLDSDLNSEFQEAEEDEQSSIAEYNETKERTENSLASLSAQLDSLNAELNELNKCIVVQGGVVQSATAKLERNSKLAEDAGAMCKVFVEEYHSAAAGRKEELDLIYVIKQKVEARLGNNH